MIKFSFITNIVILGVGILGCTDEAHPNRQKYPYLVTNNVTNVTIDGAVFNAEIDLPGTSTVTDYGFVWSPYRTPTFNDFKVSLGKNVTKKFSAFISSDLDNDQNYSVTAYAKTEDNIVYGSHVVFRSSGSSPPQVFSIIPDHGPGNTELKIIGKNFGHGNPYQQKRVSLGWYNFMDLVSFTDTLIIAKTPPNYTMPKGTYEIELFFSQRIYFTTKQYTVD